MEKMRLPDELLDAVSGGKIYVRTPDGQERPVEGVYTDDRGEILFKYRGADNVMHAYATGADDILSGLKYCLQDMVGGKYVYNYEKVRDSIV